MCTLALMQGCQTAEASRHRAAHRVLVLKSDAFEAVGITSTVDLAVRCVRKGGRVTLVGNVAPKVDFPLQVAVTRELTIFGSCASRGDYPACLEMLTRGTLNPTPLISAVVPLAEGANWFQRLYRKEPGLLKVVLKP